MDVNLFKINLKLLIHEIGQWDFFWLLQEWQLSWMGTISSKEEGFIST